MKKITLTVAEFLILVKVQEEIDFNYYEPDTYISTNADKKNATEGLDELMPELMLVTEVFDDVIECVEEYNDDLTEEDPAVVALLEKLKAVEEFEAEEEAETEENESE